MRCRGKQEYKTRQAATTAAARVATKKWSFKSYWCEEHHAYHLASMKKG